MKRRMLRNLNDLRDYLGADTIQGMNRRLYKDTACGASISLYSARRAWHNGQDWSNVRARAIKGFTIQTIIEGSDAEVNSDLFRFPVSAEYVDTWINEMESEAARLWDEANSAEAPE